MDNLTAHIGSLPQELYDQIYHEVFGTISIQVEIDIDINDADKPHTSHKPPVQVCVTQASRKQFAKSYYARTTFVFEKQEVLLRWISSLTTSHSLLLQDVRLIIAILLWNEFHNEEDETISTKSDRAIVDDMILSKQVELHQHLMAKGWTGNLEVFQTEARFTLAI